MEAYGILQYLSKDETGFDKWINYINGWTMQ